MSLSHFLKLFSFSDCFSPSSFILRLCSLLPPSGEKRTAYALVVVDSATSPSPPPHGRRLRLVAIASVSWLRLHLVAVGSAHRYRLRLLTSATWPSASLVAVGSASWPSLALCGHRLYRGRGLRSSLSPLPPPLHHVAVGFALWPSTPVDSFCLVAIGLVIIGFSSSPPPRGVGSAHGRGLRLVASALFCLVAIGSASWRGLCLVGSAS